MTQQSFKAIYQSWRTKSVPLAGILTLDLQATEKVLICENKALAQEEKSKAAAANILLRWDCITGVQALNEAAREWSSAECRTIEQLAIYLEGLPENSAILLHNPAIYLSPVHPDYATLVQALSNCRDSYKSSRRLVVLLGGMLPIPPELSQDFILYEEPLPNAQQYQEMISTLYTRSSIPPAINDVLQHASDALRGLSLFAAEQQVALAIKSRSTGLDLPTLWEHKRQVINRSRFLTLQYDLPNFESLGGCNAAKGFLKKLQHGKRPYGAVLWLDELEKMFAASDSDTSGVAQDALGYLLWWTEQIKAMALLFLGMPGASKSWTAQCTAGEFGIPCLRGDLGACKDSLVGNSEANLRRLVQMSQAIAGNDLLIIGTCNSTSKLPSALLRRFKIKFFFDLLDNEEKLSVWDIHIKRHNLSVIPDEMPDDTGWTGAEIAVCCELASELNCSLQEAAQYVVPISVSAASEVKKLQQEASGKYLSASYQGWYQAQEQREGRKLTL